MAFYHWLSKFTKKHGFLKKSRYNGSKIWNYRVFYDFRWKKKLLCFFWPTARKFQINSSKKSYITPWFPHVSDSGFRNISRTRYRTFARAVLANERRVRSCVGWSVNYTVRRQQTRSMPMSFGLVVDSSTWYVLSLIKFDYFVKIVLIDPWYTHCEVLSYTQFCQKARNCSQLLCFCASFWHQNCSPIHFCFGFLFTLSLPCICE